MALPIVDSPELHALRKELGILHGMFSMLSAATMPAGQWEKARDVLGYVEGLINVAQAKADALTPNVPAASDGPIIPSKALTAVPDPAPTAP